MNGLSSSLEEKVEDPGNKMGQEMTEGTGNNVASRDRKGQASCQGEAKR